MKEFLKGFVAQDSAEAWEEFKSGMPWVPSDRELGLVSELNFERISMENKTPEAIEQLLSASTPGTIWAEFFVYPGISLPNDYYPMVVECLQLSQINGLPSMNSLAELYRSDRPLSSGASVSLTTLLAVSCPRCHLIFVDGDVEAEFEPDDEESWTDSECPACNGSGEWVYELPLETKREPSSETKRKETDFKEKCQILSDLWLNHKDDEAFQDFIRYNDLGLPLAYSLSEEIVQETEAAREFVEATFSLLLSGLDIEDQGFTSFEQLLLIAEKRSNQS